jgi:hypothetical protein
MASILFTVINIFFRIILRQYFYLDKPSSGDHYFPLSDLTERARHNKEEIRLLEVSTAVTSARTRMTG